MATSGIEKTITTATRPVTMFTSFLKILITISIQDFDLIQNNFLKERILIVCHVVMEDTVAADSRKGESFA